MSDIRQWLTGLGLERFGDAFEREELTPANLAELTDARIFASYRYGCTPVEETYTDGEDRF